MKPSGIEWIGDIPDDWEVRRGKYTLDLLMRPIRDNDEIITCFRDGQVTRRSNRREDGFTFADKEIGYQGILKGDLVIHGMDGFAGAIGISDSDGKGSPVLNVCRPKNGSDTRYINYYLRTLALQNVFIALSTGIRERSCDLRWEKIAELLFTIPPLKTQQKIADYLDEKCGEIDATISKQKESIEKLKAYKQSLISETVTKGLDKSAPLKPSGIDYLGDIPSHWEIKKLKFLVSLIDNKTKDGHSISLENIESGTGKLIETENTYDGEGISFKENDLLFGKLRPYLAKVYLSALKGRALGDFYVMRANKGTNPNFLKFVLLSDWFIKIVDSSTYGTKMPRASWDFTGGMRIPLPPISEQDCISSYLEIKCSEVDTFIIEKQNIIQKLDAYKKSLIFECVTGKKRI